LVSESPKKKMEREEGERRVDRHIISVGTLEERKEMS
jgi:hypothetical protein